MTNSNASDSPTAEHQRLAEESQRLGNWKRWGTYLSERQWGTVREDYSATGEAWDDFPHEQARSRAYRWGEDGLLGWCDRQCRLCFGLALWNGHDPILKERLFGLTGPQGNHGEDVKEYYYYLDATPTHSYAKGLYRYPQAAFPYQQLLDENRRRGLSDREFELIDTGVFSEQRYFDVVVEYAKQTPNDTLIRISIKNCGPDAAPLSLLPTFWFRNTWIWGCRHEGCSTKPRMEARDDGWVTADHETLGRFLLGFGPHPDGNARDLLFTENETNSKLLFGSESYTPYVKDAFHRYVIEQDAGAVNPEGHGTKVAALYQMTIAPGEQRVFTARLTSEDEMPRDPFGNAFDETFSRRQSEAEAFYANVVPDHASPAKRAISRQAYAGLLWTKQFYHYIVADWLDGDLSIAPPPAQRHQGRNRKWKHLYARDILSMPDKWEYPWFAAWDLAFHMVPMASIDPVFAKQQLLTLMREWYMHPNGQLPAYEYALGDVNPPVHAWACLRVYQLSAPPGKRDHSFLAKAFQRLLLNFTWWVNQVDATGENVFAGGFLGLDNIGVFDRSKGLPSGARLEQADGTAWMAFYCSTMLTIALELARVDKAYSEMASKFLDHFVRITDAINTLDGEGLWDDADGFYYDRLHIDGTSMPLKVRSLVGLMPLIAVNVLDEGLVNQLPEVRKRLEWFMKYRHSLVRHLSIVERQDGQRCMLLSIPSREKLARVLSVLLDENEFLSPFGVRSLSKIHADQPFELTIRDEHHQVAYVPGESDSGMFGGNSNWRGPIWFPVNFLLIEALEQYHSFYGDDLRIECPTGSGQWMNLQQVAEELNRRLTGLFLRSAPDKARPCLGRSTDPAVLGAWHEYILFHEYFDADTGEGLGASHQTGWTALIVNCIQKLECQCHPS